MNALIAIFRVIEIIFAFLSQKRGEKNALRQSKLEADALALKKLKKAMAARQKKNLSRQSTNPTSRDKPSTDSLRKQKYQRD